MDKHQRLFQAGDTVVGPYGTARVVQIEKATDNPIRKVWLYNKTKGKHQVKTTDVVKI